MLKKKDFVVYSVIIYFVLILTAYLVRDKTRFNVNEVCRPQYPCVRFCCENIKTCNEEFFRRNFNESSVQSEAWMSKADDLSQVKSRIKLLFGKPKCKLEEISQEWNFTQVSKQVCNYS